MRHTDAPFSAPEARARAASLALHAAIVAALLLIRAEPPPHYGSLALLIPVDLGALPSVALERRGGGSGGGLDPLPASQGRPPRFTAVPLAGPSAHERPARLEVEPSLAGDVPALPTLDVTRFGDPFAAPGPPSNGPGRNGGIGAGDRGGVGPGDGSGLGPGPGGTGVYTIGGGVTAPRLLRSVEPAYSEEARKAKFQGVVALEVIVRPDGRPGEIRILRPLGMGLDEKAIEAVRQWVFAPGRRDGEPVPVKARVEVRFRLL